MKDMELSSLSAQNLNTLRDGIKIVQHVLLPTHPFCTYKSGVIFKITENHYWMKQNEDEILEVKDHGTRNPIYIKRTYRYFIYNNKRLNANILISMLNKQDQEVKAFIRILENFLHMLWRKAHPTDIEKIKRTARYIIVLSMSNDLFFNLPTELKMKIAASAANQLNEKKAMEIARNHISSYPAWIDRKCLDLDILQESSKLELFNAEKLVLTTLFNGPHIIIKMKNEHDIFLKKSILSAVEKLLLLKIIVNLTIYYFKSERYEEGLKYREEIDEYFEEICAENFLEESQKAKWSFAIGIVYQTIEYYYKSDSYIKGAIQFEKKGLNNSSVLHQYYLFLIETEIKTGKSQDNAPDIARESFLTAIQFANQALKLPMSEYSGKIHFCQGEAYFLLSANYGKRNQFKMKSNALFMAILAYFNGLKITKNPEIFINSLKTCNYECLKSLENLKKDYSKEFSEVNISYIKSKFNALSLLIDIFIERKLLTKEKLTELNIILRELKKVSALRPNLIGFWQNVLAGMPLKENNDFPKGRVIIFITFFAGKEREEFANQLYEKYKELKDKHHNRTIDDELLLLAVAVNLEINNVIKFGNPKPYSNPFLSYRDNYFNYTKQINKYYRAIGSKELIKKYKTEWYAVIGDVFAIMHDYKNAVRCYKDAVDLAEKDFDKGPLEEIIKYLKLISLLIKYIIAP